MAVSKRLRHEIFRRDNHTCQSCGAKAPDVKLQPDHVVPVALGGSDDPSNLQTLCEDCNGGKSATPPDASTVAKVAGDAERWAQAMQVAADNLTDEHRIRLEARTAFDAKWTGWSEGRPPLPRPSDWEGSVDDFIRAGLPLPVLLDCIDIAMSKRHIPAAGVFKYMCGVAWKEVRKLHSAARIVVGTEGSQKVAPADIVSELPGRDEIVSGILSLLSDDEKEDVGLDEREMASLSEDGEDQIVEVVDAVLRSLRADTAWLASSAIELLENLPDGIGEYAMKIARFRLYDQYELANFTRQRFADMAMGYASRLLQVRDAERSLSSVTPEARGEWIAYARALHDTHPRDGWYSEIEADTAIIHAATCAEMLGDSDYRHVNMCGSHGEHIRVCPRAAQYRVYIAELDCCAPDLEATHQGHRLCEHHMALMVDGNHFNRQGERLTARAFKELDDE
ncbi:HNH endonuclease [Nonomuraea sp. NPDC050643]|uniref:HNH endonuclease n=1 Tax=Nonomuraea sp. NPDC050643 TaxID=3155660 RepID=UPI0033D828BB